MGPYSVAQSASLLCIALNPHEEPLAEESVPSFMEWAEKEKASNFPEVLLVRGAGETEGGCLTTQPFLSAFPMQVSRVGGGDFWPWSGSECRSGKAKACERPGGGLGQPRELFEYWDGK